MNPTILSIADRHLSLDRGAAVVRWSAAIVFMAFGASKFVNHASEQALFRHYALPAPDVLLYVIGALEVVGGLLLASGRLVKLAALAHRRHGRSDRRPGDRSRRSHQSYLGAGPTARDGLP